MEFFGYRIEKISDADAAELDRAKEILAKHGFRAVRETQDKTKKRESVKRATAARSQAAEAKMQAALSLLRFSDEKITAYRLSKESFLSCLCGSVQATGRLLVATQFSKLPMRQCTTAKQNKAIVELSKLPMRQCTITHQNKTKL